jgi:hypothetical protein
MKTINQSKYKNLSACRIGEKCAKIRAISCDGGEKDIPIYETFKKSNLSFSNQQNMKKIKFITPFALMLSCFLFHYSCEKRKGCKFLVQDETFTFRLVDQYGVNQIARWGARYLSDSIFVTKFDGAPPNQLGILPDGNIGFFIPDDYNEALDSFLHSNHCFGQLFQ